MNSWRTHLLTILNLPIYEHSMSYLFRSPLICINNALFQGARPVYILLDESQSVSFFLGLNLRHMDAPRLGVKLALQLPACATATATWDLGCVCDPRHSSERWQILKPLSKARDRIHIFTDISGVHYHWATTGTPFFWFYCSSIVFRIFIFESSFLVYRNTADFFQIFYWGKIYTTNFTILTISQWCCWVSVTTIRLHSCFHPVNPSLYYC